MIGDDMKILYPAYEGDWTRTRSAVLGFLTVTTLLGTFLIEIGLPDDVAGWAPYCLAIVLALQWKGPIAIASVTVTALVLLFVGDYVGPLGDLQSGTTSWAIGAVTITGVGLVCLYVDYSRQRLVRSRDVIASSRSRLRSFVNNLHSSGIVLCDIRGRITEWSHGTQLLTGYSEEQMLGQALCRAFPRRVNSVVRWSQLCRQARRRGKVTREDAFQHQDGSWCWIHTVMKPLRNKFGRLQGYSLVIHEITKATAFAPSTGVKVCPASPILTNGSNVVMYRSRFEPRRALQYVDAHVSQLLSDSGGGLPPQQAQALGEWVHPLDRDRVWNTIEEAVRAGRSYMLVYRLVTAGGADKWVWDEGEAARTDEGIIVGLEGFLVEID
jgi:hypothetical protein